MNKELEQFLDYIIKPESVECIKGYVHNQIILDHGLSVCCNYRAGTGSIMGTVWGKSVIILYNHFYHQENFIFRLNNAPRVPPISLAELKRFFTLTEDVSKPQIIEVNNHG